MSRTDDIVLIYLEDQPISFARIERIEPDVRPGWFRVKLFVLQVPLQSVTWILREAYINGAEFTMSGKRMRIERVVCPDEDALSADETQKTGPDTPAEPSGAKVIDMKSLKNKR